MIPIRDQNPTSSPAVITILLIAINIAVFLTEPIFAGGRTDQQQAVRQIIYFECHAAVPYELTHGQTLAQAADKGIRLDSREEQVFAEVERERCPHKNVWFSLLASMFLHGSILHIAGNMLFLWIFGNNVEDRLGKIKYIVFYLVSGLAAAYAQSAVFPSSAVPLIGASGAIAGVLGAYLLMFPRARIVTLVFFFFITWIVVPAWLMIGLWFLLQLVSSVGSVSGDTGVAYMAHVGGFIAGMLLLLLLRPKRPEPTPIDLPY
jgi:membrane associated rhomboid family serine protease